MTIESIRAFLGWCTIINFGLLIVTMVKIVGLQSWASKMHAKMFNIDEESVRRLYFQFLIVYIIAILMFNFVPYIALRLIG